VAAPVYMTNMLVRHTGKKLLEKHMARSKGAAYDAPMFVKVSFDFGFRS
jgi:hypothetical protein